MNFSSLQYAFSKLFDRLIFRTVLVSILAIVSAGIAVLAKDFIPESFALKMGADAVDSVLVIIASSMLAVTTFSLSTVMSAFFAASANGTPRATSLLIADTTTQNMLATFIGAFVYAIVGILLLKTGIYGSSGRVVLFIVTIFVLGLIVVTLLRWIDFLIRFAKLSTILDKIEDAATKALAERRKHPYLGGWPLTDPATQIPSDAWPVFSERQCYVEHIDVEALNRNACDGEIFVMATPGTFAHQGWPLAYVRATRDKVDVDAIASAFTLGATRSFKQDPRLGLIALSEVASRALSPAVNDPGTAIEVIGRLSRILAGWSQFELPPEPEYPKVYVPPLAAQDMIQDSFAPIARDGAGLFEVQVRLQKALAAITRCGLEDLATAARDLSGLARERAHAAMTLEEDKRNLDRAIQSAFAEGARGAQM